MLSDELVDRASRQLFTQADLILAVVFLSPEAGAPPLGLTPPEFYVGSRAAPLGRVPGAVVAAVFATIEPSLMTSAADRIWTTHTPEQLLEARLDMALAVLERTLGPEPEGVQRAVELLTRAAEAAPVGGHPLFAALKALPLPESPLGHLWRLCDLVREHRGSSHVNAFSAAGLDSAQINVLTELWRGQPIGSEASVVNGWRRKHLAAALETLRARGLVTGEEITEAGRSFREEIEVATSRQERPVIGALGADLDELHSLLEPSCAALGQAMQPPYWWHVWKPGA